jgi:hypothetical protein
MYKNTMILLVSYIKSIKPDLEVFDATTEFKEPENYASIYITSITPTTPHENWIDSAVKNDDIKTFTYKETNYINIRVDFRGDEASENMALFKSSFLKEVQQELLQEAGFGFLGLGAISPISSLRDSKIKQGMTVTLKLVVSNIVVDESQLVKETKITVSKI